ncbi:lysylphosphatidylglycerol synthase transmembrane domain-containing protein [Tateyamaria sp. SN6-1]|uniref:lysylphosphatidylglycerol synthase transmembrane domain-containing protein n=1 Tax=Tateyamaria sp. SN6-1 TaxID=3092148 RepID=UPI0039F4C031
MTGQWIKFAVSVLCLAALLWWVDASSVFAMLQGVDVAWIAMGLLAITISTVAMAHRWQVVASAFDVQITYRVALREYYLAQLVNMALPGGVAGDVTRAVRTRHQADLTRAAQSVMAERLLGQIAMVGFMSVGFALALLRPGGPDWGLVAWLVLAVVVGCVAVAAAISQTDTATGRFLTVTLRTMRQPVIALHGTLTTISLVIAFYCCARALDVTIPTAGWFTLIPLILCAMLVPLSIGGWGWREGAAAALFPIIGAPASAGVAVGITYGLVVLLAALPAAFILVASPIFETVSSKGKPDLP